MKYRIFALMLSGILCLSLFPAVAAAAADQPVPIESLNDPALDVLMDGVRDYYSSYEFKSLPDSTKNSFFHGDAGDIAIQYENWASYNTATEWKDGKTLALRLKISGDKAFENGKVAVVLQQLGKREAYFASIKRIDKINTTVDMSFEMDDPFAFENGTIAIEAFYYDDKGKDTTDIAVTFDNMMLIKWDNSGGKRRASDSDALNSPGYTNIMDRSLFIDQEWYYFDSDGIATEGRGPDFSSEGRPVEEEPVQSNVIPPSSVEQAQGLTRLDLLKDPALNGLASDISESFMQYDIGGPTPGSGAYKGDFKDIEISITSIPEPVIPTAFTWSQNRTVPIEIKITGNHKFKNPKLALIAQQAVNAGPGSLSGSQYVKMLDAEPKDGTTATILIMTEPFADTFPINIYAVYYDDKGAETKDAAISARALNIAHWEQRDGKRTAYVDLEGHYNYYLNCFVAIDGIRYYFDTEGYLTTGWIEVQHARYYTDATGAVKIGIKNIDGILYCIDENGELRE